MTSTEVWNQHKNEIARELSLREPAAGGEWVGQECPLCDSRGHDRLYISDSKGLFHCKHCGEGGAASKLVPDLVLGLRGLRDDTIAHFEIDYDPDKGAHTFPVRQGDVERTKFKSLPGTSGPKYYWDKRGGKVPAIYNADAIDSDTICFVEGEPDVWIMRQTGSHNVVSLTMGARTVSKATLRELRDAGVQKAYIIYDNDEEGRKGAGKLAGSLSDVGIAPVIVELPSDLGHGGDITDLYARTSFDDRTFKREIRRLIDEAGHPQSQPAAEDAAGKVADSAGPFITDADLDALDPNWRDRWIETYVRGSGEYTDAPHDFHRAVGFFLLSAIYADQLELAAMTGSVFGRGAAPNLYIMLVGASTVSRKSTCLKAARMALRRIRPDGVMANDFSPEALIEEVSKRDGSAALIVKDEFSGLLKQTKRRSGYHAQTPELLMQLYDGSPVTMVRRTTASMGVETPRVGILGATTPAALTGSTRQDDLDTGFLVRFLVTTPSTAPDRKTLRHLTGTELDAVEKPLLHLEGKARMFQLGIHSSWEFGTSNSTRSSGASWGMSDDAADLLDRYGQEIEHRAKGQPELDMWFARLLETVPKLALLAAAIRKGLALVFTAADRKKDGKPDHDRKRLHNPISSWTGQITEGDMAYAIWFIERLAPGTSALLAQLGATEDQKLTNRIYAAIRGAGPGGIQRSKLMDNRNLKPRVMDEVAEALEARGRIRVERDGKATMYVAIDPVEA